MVASKWQKTGVLFSSKHYSTKGVSVKILVGEPPNMQIVKFGKTGNTKHNDNYAFVKTYLVLAGLFTSTQSTNCP